MNKILTDKSENIDFFWMANILPTYSGLPMNIWIYPKKNKEFPRIKVQKSYSPKVSSALFDVTIENEPKLVGNKGRIKKQDIERVKKFIKLNFDVLMDYWNHNELNLINIFERIKRVNK